MPINRQLWLRPIINDSVPGWPCPNCNTTALHLVEESLAVKESAKTPKNKDDPDWEREFTTGVFSLILMCGRADCQEMCAASGWYDVSVGYDRIDNFYHPKAIYPAPPLIPVPSKCPISIATELSAAFSLFWSDNGSCLNRIRIALERLLTHFKIKRFGKSKKGHREPIGLHSRIELLRKRRPTLADLCDRMLAVKHLGNAGSHPGSVHSDDVFDALDIFDELLQESFAKHRTALAKQVKQINKRKGPRARTK